VVREIILEGTGWRTEGDFYDAFFAAVGAPEWHGRNLNALNDSIGAGGINHTEMPYTLLIKGIESMSEEARRMVEHFRELVEQLSREGVAVSVVCEK
jgi:RNAse (barnase) inhibitor barstar